MAHEQLVPDKTQMRRYLEQGLTQQKIVEAWERDSGIRVSRSAIAMAIQRYDLKSAHERRRYEELIPWEVSSEHVRQPQARLLRFEGRRRAGLPLTHAEETWLTNWKQELEDANAVVFYSPETGFQYTERLPEHGDDLIDRSNVS